MAKLTDEQKTRLREAQERERRQEGGLLDLITSAITSWVVSLITPLVGKAVSAVVEWFAKVFR